MEKVFVKSIEKFFNYCDNEAFCNIDFILDTMLENHNNRINETSLFWHSKPKKKSCLSKKEYKIIGDYLIKIGIFTEYHKYIYRSNHYQINNTYKNIKNKEIIEIIKKTL